MWLANTQAERVHEEVNQALLPLQESKQRQAVCLCSSFKGKSCFGGTRATTTKDLSSCLVSLQSEIFSESTIIFTPKAANQPLHQGMHLGPNLPDWTCVFVVWLHSLNQVCFFLKPWLWPKRDSYHISGRAHSSPHHCQGKGFSSYAANCTGGGPFCQFVLFIPPVTPVIEPPLLWINLAGGAMAASLLYFCLPHCFPLRRMCKKIMSSSGRFWNQFKINRCYHINNINFNLTQSLNVCHSCTGHQDFQNQYHLLTIHTRVMMFLLKIILR